MRRFTSGPKPASRVRRVHGGDVVAGDAQAVAHAVVPREVRRRLRRRDHVVRRQPVARARHAHPVDGRARLLQRARGAVDRVEHLRLEPLALDQLVDDGDAQAVDPAVDHRQHRLVGGVDGGGVHPVVPGDHVEQQRRVAHRGGERPDLVERARERHQPVARHEAVGGLHADDAAQRGRLADRAAGVGARARAARTRPRPPRPSHRSNRPGRVTGRAGCGWPRTPSSRWTTPSRTRRGWSSPPGPRRRPARAPPPSRCTAAANPRGSSTSTWWEPRGCRGCP